MKKFLNPFLFVLSACFFSLNAQEINPDTLQIFDHVVFYDGYMNTNNPDKDLDDGILRHSCSLYSVPLTETQLNAIKDHLDMTVFVTACCDNYDRIGNINLAFVPKGAKTYQPAEVERIEIARFITPFMDKNKEPSTVPYNYNIDNLSPILRDKTLRENYDLWLEFELFGVPYAANKEIEGCEGRSDVFAGTLQLETYGEPGVSSGNVLVPIVIKKPETQGNNLNNYNPEATDTLGKTVKTYYFEVPDDVEDARVVLITSNHGANRGGEEYIRRDHYIYYDDNLAITYKPGRQSCEPYRGRNTQKNGIYGRRPMTDEEWQSFSNWCPGDVIDTRLILLGDVKKGQHKIKIEVPEAQFVNNQGDFPVSMYFHGKKK